MKLTHNHTFIVDNRGNKWESHTQILKTILNSGLPKDRYEIIFLGFRPSGFSHTKICSEPLVRAFYDGVLNKAQRLNAAILEAHCPVIFIWPGVYFMKKDFYPIPEDVKSPEYYLMLWLNLEHKEFPKEVGKFKNILNGFSYDMKLKPSFNDTIRLLYKFGDQPFDMKIWYLKWLIRSVGK